MIHNVQVLRFVAAAGVALSHMASLLIPTDAANRWFWSAPWTAGVDLFFVISGFIMFCLSEHSFGVPGSGRDFLKRRIIRIVPPYWFFTTLTIFIVLALGGTVGGTTIDAPQTMTSYGFIPWPRPDGKLNPIVSQGWTLNYEAFFYACFAAALMWRKGVMLICAGFIALTLIHPLVPPELFLLKFWSEPIILEFLGGIGLAKIYLGGVRLQPRAILACAALAVIVFIGTLGLRLGGLERFIHFGIPALLLSASFILAEEPQELGVFRRSLQQLGDASYTIYLSHYMIVNAVAIVWKMASIGLPWIGVGVGVAASFLFALLFFRLVERPVTDALQRRFLARPRALETVAP